MIITSNTVRATLMKYKKKNEWLHVIAIRKTWIPTDSPQYIPSTNQNIYNYIDDVASVFSSYSEDKHQLRLKPLFWETNYPVKITWIRILLSWKVLAFIKHWKVKCLQLFSSAMSAYVTGERMRLNDS